jgi:hypothetical protein
MSQHRGDDGALVVAVVHDQDRPPPDEGLVEVGWPGHTTLTPRPSGDYTRADAQVGRCGYPGGCGHGGDGPARSVELGQ